MSLPRLKVSVTTGTAEVVVVDTVGVVAADVVVKDTESPESAVQTVPTVTVAKNDDVSLTWAAPGVTVTVTVLVWTAVVVAAGRAPFRYPEQKAEAAGLKGAGRAVLKRQLSTRS